MQDIVSSTNSEKLTQRFGEHLLTTHGLAVRTCTSRVFYARGFLRAHLKAGRKKLKLSELTPELLLNYVLARARQDSPARLQAAASALRSFCRFLQMSGCVGRDLTSALPRIASTGRPSLPDYLSTEQLEDLLGSINTKTQAGLRNYAILLCLARLDAIQVRGEGTIRKSIRSDRSFIPMHFNRRSDNRFPQSRRLLI